MFSQLVAGTKEKFQTFFSKKCHCTAFESPFPILHLFTLQNSLVRPKTLPLQTPKHHRAHSYVVQTPNSCQQPFNVEHANPKTSAAHQKRVSYGRKTPDASQPGSKPLLGFGIQSARQSSS